jgi:hypothetical protein
VRCGGAIPLAKEPAPIVEARASAPPPKVARACRAMRLAGDTAVTAKPAAPRGASITPRGDELWVGWSDMRAASYADPVGAFYVRRFRAKDGQPLGAEERVLAQGNEPTLLASGADAAVVFELGGVARAVRLRADGTPDDASRVDLSHPLAKVGGVLAVASGARGDAFFWAGWPAFLQSRSLRLGGAALAPGPLVDVQGPDRSLAKYRVASRPDGFVAAWLESDGDALVVTRWKDGAPAWTARVKDVGNTYFVRLGAVGVAGDQIFTLLGGERPRLVRFTLDGARLDDVRFPIDRGEVLESTITERGIVAGARGDGDQHCLHLVGFDGKPIAPPTCAKLEAPLEERDRGMRGGPPTLVWSADTLHFVYGTTNESLRLRRWKCD